MNILTSKVILSIFFTFIILASIIFIGFFKKKSVDNYKTYKNFFNNYKKIKVGVGSRHYTLYVADDEQKKLRGLSNIDGLKEEYGMIFVFSKPDYYYFWMKNMKFSLDFIFLNKNKIVDIVENVKPNTYPNYIISKKPFDMVIELNEGQIKKAGVYVGSNIKIPSPYPKNKIFRLVNVIDGDTIRVKTFDNKIKYVRYLGVDAPELQFSNQKYWKYCYGKEALLYNEALLTNKKILLEFDNNNRIDKHGRFLAYVYTLTEAGFKNNFVNSDLISNGYARFFNFNMQSKIKSYFIKKEGFALKNNLGLWGVCGEEKFGRKCIIKGKVLRENKKLFYMPDNKKYKQIYINRLQGDQWLCTLEEAYEKGFKHAK